MAPAKAPTAPGTPILRDDLPVDVAELPVRQAGGQRGADLGEVDGGRGGGRVGADGQQQRRRGDAVGHAEAAVDELGAEADEGEQDEGLHGLDSGSGRARARSARREERGGAVGAGVSSPDSGWRRRAAGRRGSAPRGAPPSPPRRYVYQIDRLMQGGVSRTGVTVTAVRTSFRMVSHEITPPDGEQHRADQQRHPEPAGERGRVGVVVAGEARPPPAARRPPAAARPGPRRCSRRSRCRPARRVRRPARSR